MRFSPRRERNLSLCRSRNWRSTFRLRRKLLRERTIRLPRRFADWILTNHPLSAEYQMDWEQIGTAALIPRHLTYATGLLNDAVRL